MNALNTIDRVLEHVLGAPAPDSLPPFSVDALEAMSLEDVRRELAVRDVDVEAELQTLIVAAGSRTGDALSAVQVLSRQALRAELEAADVDADAYLASARALIERVGERVSDGSPPAESAIGDSLGNGSAIRGRTTPMRGNAKRRSGSGNGGRLARWGLTRRPGRIGRAVAGVAVVVLVGSVLLERYDAGPVQTATLGEPVAHTVIAPENSSEPRMQQERPHELALTTGDLADGDLADNGVAPGSMTGAQSADNSQPPSASAAVRIELADSGEEITQSRPGAGAPPRMAAALENEVPEREFTTRSLAREAERRESAAAGSAARSPNSNAVSKTLAKNSSAHEQSPPLAELERAIAQSAAPPPDAIEQNRIVSRQVTRPTAALRNPPAQGPANAATARPQAASPAVRATRRIHGRVGRSLEVSLARHLSSPETALALALVRAQVDPTALEANAVFVLHYSFTSTPVPAVDTRARSDEAQLHRPTSERRLLGLRIEDGGVVYEFKSPGASGAKARDFVDRAGNPVRPAGAAAN